MTNNNKQDVLEGDYTFYNQDFGLIFIPLPNQFKNLIDLYIAILKLSAPFRAVFNDLESLSASEKAKINSNFQSGVFTNKQSYSGWRVVPTSDRERVLKIVNRQPVNFSAPPSSMEGPKSLKTDGKFDLTEICQSVSQFLKSYLSESSFNNFENFLVQLSNNDNQIIAIYLSDQFLKNEISCFSQPDNKVFSKETMIQFLTQSPSLYHNFCWWFLKLNFQDYKPFAFETKEILCFEKHHIVPRYLKANHGLNASLEEPYNIIKIPRLIHVLLHFIRTIEFQYYEDQNYVKSLVLAEKNI